MSNEVKDYRRLPYTRKIDKVQTESVSEFVAFIAEIPWIRVHADEPEEASLLLDEIFDDAIQAMLDAGDEIPRPAGTLERYGGPEAPEVRRERARWSAGGPQLAVTFQPSAESTWASGSLDPEPELQPGSTTA